MGDRDFGPLITDLIQKCFFVSEYVFYILSRIFHPQIFDRSKCRVTDFKISNLLDCKKHTILSCAFHFSDFNSDFFFFRFQFVFEYFF